MAERVGIRVTDHYIGESGKGKSQLDGHFGVKGSQLRRLVAAALNDIITPQMLYEGVKKTMGANESAMLFQPDRSAGSGLDAQSISKLSSMAHRQYEYNAKDELVAIHLRQQTRLGNGLVVEADKLRKPGATAFAFAAPRLVAAAGVTCAARNDAPGPATTAAAAHAGANAEGAAPRAARTQPIARSNMGQELHEQKIAKGRLSRDAKQVQRLAAEQAARIARCRPSRRRA